MAKITSQDNAHVARMRSAGKPRVSAPKKGNASARTSRSGNGTKIKRH